MSLSTQPYKGTRDFYPPDKRLQKYMFGVWRKVAEEYGYEEYDAPILEPFDIYSAKSGQEIVNEQTYVFDDRGGRKVTIRPEMTPSVSRMVASKRQELSYPLRWYSIPNLWRYERPQRGRLREHWQLNIDIFGVSGNEAEIEIVTLVDDIFKRFGATREMYEIKLNSRKLVDFILDTHLGLSKSEAYNVAKLIDRRAKMKANDFIKALDEACSPESRKRDVVESLLELLEVKSIDKLPKELREHESAKELKDMIAQLKQAGVSNIAFDITLMRGFDYYTDIVFEVFDKHPDNNRAMLGGGRYDGLVGLFGVEPVATVGFGWGDVTLSNFLELHHLIPELPTETDVYLAVADNTSLNDVRKIAKSLRQLSVKVAVDLSERKLDKQIKTANKKDIRYLIVVGENEVESKVFKLKNLDSGLEESGKLKDLAKYIKNKNNASDSN